MKNSSFTFETIDHIKVFVHKWLPENTLNVKAIIQISHGMAEHSARYEEFASFLTNGGFAVYANDHRGHFKTVGSIEKQGFFAENDGWIKVVDDMFQLTQIIKEEFPEKPVFIFGHSMGSLLTRTYITKYPNSVKGIILSGTSGESGLLVKAGKLISKLIGVFKNPKAPSKLLDNMSFGKFNSYFKPNKTKFDWLSRDNENVDKYNDDPYCGAIFSNRFFYDLSWGVDFNNKKENLLRISRELPIFLVSGEKDPVGNFTKGVQKVFEIYKMLGIKDVEMKFYTDARHEIINEINRIEVYNDVIEWINKRI
jgi:alpha-beta hydrolase superfamily lysophospholipase